MNKNFSAIQRRAVQYWFIDGLSELGMAASLLLLGALFLLQQMLPRSPIRDMLFFLLAFAGMLALRQVIERIKEKQTYPNTGYVANKSGWENKRAVALVLTFTGLLLAAQFYLALKAPQTPLWMPFIGGVILAFIFSLIAYQSALPRFYYLALACLLVGGGLMRSGLNEFLATAALCALAGLMLFGLGARTRYLYTHALRQQSDEH